MVAVEACRIPTRLAQPPFPGAAFQAAEGFHLQTGCFDAQRAQEGAQRKFEHGICPRGHTRGEPPRQRVFGDRVHALIVARGIGVSALLESIM